MENCSFYVQVKVKVSICDGKINPTRLMDLMDARACKAGGVYEQCLVLVLVSISCAKFTRG